MSDLQTHSLRIHDIQNDSWWFAAVWIVFRKHATCYFTNFCHIFIIKMFLTFHATSLIDDFADCNWCYHYVVFLSVCPSVTFVHSAQTAEDINRISLLQEPHVPPRSCLNLAYTGLLLPSKILPQSEFWALSSWSWSSFPVLVFILILFSIFWLIRCSKSVVNIWVIKLFWCCRYLC